MCFKLPYIGLRGSCDNATSGKYIDDLPGISILDLSAIADGINVKGWNLLAEKEAIAIETVKRDFILMLQDKYTFEDIREVVKNYGNYSDPVVGVECIGLEINNCKRDSQVIDLSMLSFWLSEPVQTELAVSIDGIIVKSDIDFKAGENKITNVIESDAAQIDVYFNLGDTASIKKVVNCACECGVCTCNDCAEIKVFRIVNDVKEYIDWTPFNFKLLCRNSYDELICNFEKDLSDAVLYQTGIQIAMELLFTNNINPIITNKQGDAEKLLSLWAGTDNSLNDRLNTTEKKWRHDGEYYKSLSLAVTKAKNYLEKSSLAIRPTNIPFIIETI